MLMVFVLFLKITLNQHSVCMYVMENIGIIQILQTTARMAGWQPTIQLSQHYNKTTHIMYSISYTK